MRLKFRRAIIFPEFGTARRKPQLFQHDSQLLCACVCVGGGGAKCRCKEESRPPPPPPVINDGQFLRAFAEVRRQVTISFVMSVRLSA